MQKSSIHILKRKVIQIVLTVFFAMFFINLYGQSSVILTPADPGNWTVPDGVTSITVECWGAGGAGGTNGNNRNGSGGGGGGAYSIINNLTVIPNQTYILNVGIGGVAPGGNGGDTWFNNTSTVLAQGGQGGGNGSNGSPGTGGPGGDLANGVGDLQFSGGAGGDGSQNNNGYGGGGGSSAGTSSNGELGGNGTNGSAGLGGSAVDDGGAGGDGGTIGNPGLVGSTPGGGGGGSGESALGGAGADGKMVITYTVGADCPIKPDISSTLGPNFCQGDTESLLTASINTTGGTGSYTPYYQWYYNVHPINTNTIDGSTIKINGATSNTYTAPTTTASRRYYFCVTWTNENTCGQTDADQNLASDPVEINVSEPPTPADAGLNRTLCTSSTTLDGNNPTVGTGEWFVISGSANVQNSNLYNSTVTSLGAGVNVFEWRISNGSCAISVSQVSITNDEPSTPDAGLDQFLCGTSTNLDGDAPTEGTGEWSLVSGSATFTDINNPLMAVSALGNGDNIFRWTITKGTCTLTDDVIINSQAVLPATPGAIVGSLEVSPGNLYVYTIAAVPFATNYTWTWPSASGWAYVSGQGTTSLTITGGDDSTSGFVTVYASNTCGDSDTSSTTLITSVYLPPHENCNQCHITHNSLGSALTNLSGNANLCLNCHHDGGAANAKPLSNADKAVPGTLSGTSHAWDVAAVNPLYDAELPVDSEMGLRIVDVDLNGDEIIDVTNAIVCSTCHNQHNSSQGSPYLRMDNTGDDLCKDCHRKRDVGIYTDDQTLNKGSHPVGVAYPSPGADDRFEDSPLDNALILPGNNVECSTCHSVHDVTDTNNISTDGYILRVANDVNLCKDCHNYQPHNGMDCLDCHTVHNTNKTNIMMIRDQVTNPTLAQDIDVVFTSRGTTATPPGPDANSFADSSAPYTDGICEACHDPNTPFDDADDGVPNHAYNTAPDPDNGNHYAGEKCTSCHQHNNIQGSFKAPEPGGGGECGSCHPVNGITGQMTTGSHAIHISRGDGLYAYMNNTTDPTMCNICHSGFGDYGNDTDALNSAHPEHNDGNVDVSFDINGLANSLGRTSGASYTGSPNGTCNNVYCHSTGTSARRGGILSNSGSDQWGSGSLADTYYDQVWGSSTSTQNCDLCHPGDGDIIQGEWTAPYLIFADNVNDTPVAGHPTSGAHQANAHLNADDEKWFYSTDGTANTVVDNVSETGITGLIGYSIGWHTARGTSVQCFWCHNADPAHVNSTDGKLQGTYGTQAHLDGQTWFNPFNYRTNSPTTDPLNPPDDGSFTLPGQGTMAPGMYRASGTHCASGQSCW